MQFEYAMVKRLLPKPVLAFLAHYYDLRVRAQDDERFTRDEQCPLSFSKYGDPAIDALLEFCKPKLSKACGLELVPTYSYTRVYVKGDILKRHTDRPACEISATVCIGIPPGAKASSIYVKDKAGVERRLDMQEGDACLYAGCEIEHWRDPIDITGYRQAFLHFVDRNGPFFPEHKFDGRPRLGAPKHGQSI